MPRFAPNKVVLWDEDAVALPSSSNAPRSRVRTRAKGSDKRSGSEDESDSSAPSTVFSLEKESAERENASSSSSPERGETSLSSVPDVPGVSATRRNTDSTGDAAPSTASLAQDSGESAPLVQVIPDTIEHTHDGSDRLLEAEEDASHLYVVNDAASRRSDSSQGAGLGTRDGRSSPKSPERQKSEKRLPKGAVAAELEFGETVQGIYLAAFDIAANSVREGGEYKGLPSLRATLLLVVLQRRLVIFELGPHLSNVDSSPSWGIRQRSILDVHPEATKCSPTMATIPQTNTVLLAMPGRQRGHVHLSCLAFSNTSHTSITSSMAGSSSIIAAHSGSIASLALSSDGQLLCTASERGTLLRLWSTQIARVRGARRGVPLQAELVGELRRGSNPATILSMAIDPARSLLAAASDKGTVHFFNLEALQDAARRGPRDGGGTGTPARGLASGGRAGGSSAGDHLHGSSLSDHSNRFLPSALHGITQSIPASVMPQFLRAQWSFAQYRIPLHVFSSRTTEGGLQFEERAAPARRSGGRQRFGAEEEEAAAIGDTVVPAPPPKLEGGWDTMRTRLQDIRRGERSTEERIWLTWIPARVDGAESDARGADREVATGPAHTPHAAPYQLIAITNSGSHYRLGVRLRSGRDGDPGPAEDAGGSVVLDMYRQDKKGLTDQRRASAGGLRGSDDEGDALSTAAGAGASAIARAKSSQEGACWLIEHTRFGTRDPWVD